MNARRDFFRKTLAGAAVATGATASAPVQARDNLQLSPDALGLLFDSTLCVGCKACVAACKSANNLPPDYNTPAHGLWDVPLDTTAKTFNVIKVFQNGKAEHKDRVEDGYAFSKKSCLHCVDPSCVSACPVSAMTKDPKTGIVGYDPDACIGCRYCVAACPFEVPKFDYDSPRGQIGKCELCRHRIPDGQFAACAEVCPTGATLYGKVADLKVEAKRRLSLKAGDMTRYPRGDLSNGPDRSWEGPVAPYVQHLYGDKELGGTQMMYLSAVPFHNLGMPTLPERSYAAKSESLQHGLYGGLVLPIALFGAMTWVARRNSKNDEHGDGGEQ
ncbi:MAG: hydrogenase 2 operon protein HybA [Rhodocyclales bacterium]|nr:hydrogenase 2 operon protein HybA [Rhodocyclales bacterium]